MIIYLHLAPLCFLYYVKLIEYDTFSLEKYYTQFNSLVLSKLFSCSTVWAGISRNNLHKLQLMQNFAAHILTNTRSVTT